MATFLQKLRVVAMPTEEKSSAPAVATTTAAPVYTELQGVFPDGMTPYQAPQGVPTEADFNTYVIDQVMALPEIAPLKAYIETFNKLKMIPDQSTRNAAAVGTCGFTEAEIGTAFGSFFPLLNVYAMVFEDQTTLEIDSKYKQSEARSKELDERIQTLEAELEEAKFARNASLAESGSFGKSMDEIHAAHISLNSAVVKELATLPLFPAQPTK